MGRALLPLFLAFVLLSATGCVTKVVKFNTGATAKVSLLNPGGDDEGEPLGDTPLTVDLSKIEGKVVKITEPGKDPAYWIAAETAGETTEATIKLRDAAGAQHAGDDHADGKVGANNLVVRLLMRAYKALSGRRFQVARELADQAATLDPHLAAPQVIRGLTYYQEGNVGEARAALAKAQALDPDDKDIDALLKVVR